MSQQQENISTPVLTRRASRRVALGEKPYQYTPTQKPSSLIKEPRSLVQKASSGKDTKKIVPSCRAPAERSVERLLAIHTKTIDENGSSKKDQAHSANSSSSSAPFPQMATDQDSRIIDSPDMLKTFKTADRDNSPEPSVSDEESISLSKTREYSIEWERPVDEPPIDFLYEAWSASPLKSFSLSNLKPSVLAPMTLDQELIKDPS